MMDSESVLRSKSFEAKRAPLRGWIRAAGFILLLVLLWRLDRAAVVQTLATSDLRLVLLSLLLIVPLIAVKTVRWQRILAAQTIHFAFWPALLAYFSSLFAGFLTPGRLGEFVKALHVQRAGEVSAATAFATVLADRLFDLYVLLVVGSAALTAMPKELGGWWMALLLAALLLPPLLLLHSRLFAWLQTRIMRLHPLGAKMLGPQSPLVEVRNSLCHITRGELVVALLLTLFAYGIFFAQCYLLALAVGLGAGFMPVTYAVALGSLVTLLPISISGLGTREAAMIAYLGTIGTASEAALSFSLLVFATFYIGGSLIGLVAWWLQPLPLPLRRQGWKEAAS